MTTEVEQKKEEVVEEKKEERFDAYSYSCQVLLENTSLEKAKDKSFPSDAYLVWYNVEGNEILDLTRSAKKANIFDMYYDKYGKGAVQSIEYGHGTIRPNLWNVKPPERKKRKRRMKEDE